MERVGGATEVNRPGFSATKATVTVANRSGLSSRNGSIEARVYRCRPGRRAEAEAGN